MVVKQIAEKFGVSLSTAKRRIEQAAFDVPFTVKGIKDAKNRVVEQKDYKLADVKGLFAKAKAPKESRAGLPKTANEGY